MDGATTSRNKLRDHTHRVRRAEPAAPGDMSFWIGAATTNAERSLLYFDGDGVGSDLLRLLAWTAVVVALLVLPVSRKLARQREPTNDRAAPRSPVRSLA